MTYKFEMGKANNTNMIIGAIVFLMAGAGIYAFASGNSGTVYKQDEAVCSNFCTLAGTQFGFVDKDQTCNCLATQTQADIENDALIQWTTVVNAGRISNIAVQQPISEENKQLINQQLQQQQLMQQQIAAQQGNIQQ